MCHTDRRSHRERRFLKKSSDDVRVDCGALVGDGGHVAVRVRGVRHMLDTGVRQGDRVGPGSHTSPVVGLNGIEVVVGLGVGDGVLVAVRDDLVGVDLAVRTTSCSIGDGVGGVCNRDMVVGCSGNNWGNMGNNRGCMGNMGNDRGSMGNNRGWIKSNA